MKSSSDEYTACPINPICHSARIPTSKFLNCLRSKYREIELIKQLASSRHRNSRIFKYYSNWRLSNWIMRDMANSHLITADQAKCTLKGHWKSIIGFNQWPRAIKTPQHCQCSLGAFKLLQKTTLPLLQWPSFARWTSKWMFYLYCALCGDKFELLMLHAIFQMDPCTRICCETHFKCSRTLGVVRQFMEYFGIFGKEHRCLFEPNINQWITSSK